MTKNKAVKTYILRAICAAAAVLLLVSAIVLLIGYYRENKFIKEYDGYITQLCYQNNVDKNLVYAIIKAESGFKYNAISYKGAAGLMQLMPDTAKYIAQISGDTTYNEQNLFLPRLNLKYGIIYIGYLQSKFTHSDAVIAAYNAGEGNVRKWLGSDGKLSLDAVAFKETQEYLTRVNAFYKGYIDRFGY